MDKEKIISLNQKGFFPQEKETLDQYLKRFDEFKSSLKQELEKTFFLTDRMKKPHWNWIEAALISLYDFSPVEFIAYYNNKGLSFLQPAATMIIENEQSIFSFIQLKKAFKKGRFLFYGRDEVLAHEAVHAARAVFEDSRFEEIFAYAASSSKIRQILGPVLQQKKDFFLFFLFLVLLVFSSFFENRIFFHFGIIFFASFFSFSLFRVLYLKRKLKKTMIKLKKIFSFEDKARFVLFRITREEIECFSKWSVQKIRQYIEANDELRWQIIKKVYQ